MREPLSARLRDSYEIAVIGGGINGCGIAQALAEAGYDVLLVERHDFGAGTTSRSTRLIHGGLRYLEHAEIGLVFESLHAREVLLEEFPQLVRPLELLLPVYHGSAYPQWKAWAGLAAYDVLSLRKSLPRHHRLSSAATLALEPRLRNDGLQAGFTFWDGQVELPERLAVESALAAERAGATVANYAEALGFNPNGGRYNLGLRDLLDGTDNETTADLVINAAGPWADQVLGRANVKASRLVGGTRGSHVAVPRERLGMRKAIYAPARSDGRPFFILPWLDLTLIGTTDVSVESIDHPAATSSEVDYLLREANWLLEENLTLADILYTYAGIRPLPYSRETREGKVTRRHFLVDHQSAGFPGVYSLVGGKLTTYRSVGRRAVKIARRRLGHRWPVTPGRSETAGAVRQQHEPICQHSPEPRSVVAHAIVNEHATGLADVLLRRTPVGWRSCQGVHVAPELARLIGEILGWDDTRMDDEVSRYTAELEATHPTATAAATNPQVLAV
jgi:glycerol-3-phosphate dehydrogenase